MSSTLHQHGNYCTISFNSDEDMDKGLEYIMYETKGGFSMIDDFTIVISGQQCKMLEEVKQKESINYIYKN